MLTLSVFRWKGEMLENLEVLWKKKHIPYVQERSE